MDRYHLGRKLLICCCALLLVCGCSPPPESVGPSEASSVPASSAVSASSSVSASSAPEEKPQKELSLEDYDLWDLAGEPIVNWEPVEPWPEESAALEVPYVLVREPGQEGYIRLDDGEADGKWGSAQSLEAYSIYYIYPAYTEKTQLSQSGYSFSPASPIPGILQVDRYAILFFPYKSVEEPFFRVEPWTIYNESETYAEETTLSCTDGATLEIKPLAVRFLDADYETLQRLLAIGDRDELETPRWFDVKLQFSSVEVRGWSDNMWEVFDTRPFGTLAEKASLTINGELTLTDRVWTGFAYTYFPRSEE